MRLTRHQYSFLSFSFTKLLRQYYDLLKPGIIYGNLLTMTGGFLLAFANAPKVNFDWPIIMQLVGMWIGLALVIGSGCVFNNHFDRDIDSLMTRTQKRPTVTGDIDGLQAAIYALILGFFGLLILLTIGNWLTFGLGLIGLFVYLPVYTLWLKRTSIYSTVIGAVSGAMPPVIGYCSFKGVFDAGACYLFLILFLWQMPHSYAIALFRQGEYIKAGLPSMPATIGKRQTKITILLYTGMLLGASFLTLFAEPNIPWLLLIGMALVNGIWLVIGIKLWPRMSDHRWAKMMFSLSLLSIMCFSLLLSLQPLI